MRNHYKLMIPGPIEVAPDVLAHMSDPLTAHYGDKWVDIWDGTVSNLQHIIGTTGEVIIVVGSGHTANDISINSLFNADDKVLTLNNGLFGQRLVDICEGHGLDQVILTKPWGTPFAPSDIHEAVARNPDLKALLVVHGETSTGIANPVKELAAAAKKHGLLVMADTIASLGGHPYKMDDWQIDITTCASQKALGAPPGLSLMAVSEFAWSIMEGRRKPRGFMTDLQNLRHFSKVQAEFHPHPGTMPVNTFVALRKSTDLILEEGIDATWARHEKVARVVRAGVRAMGLQVMATEESACANLTVILSEDFFVPQAYSEFMKETYGIQLGLGLGDYLTKSIRIGHMGYNANLEAVIPCLVGLEQFLRQQGHDIQRGTCLAGLE
jgi:alanine-glyoxylate transaminase / serine-glyoxylate transaminase / serine-pyruvate transaminase